MGDTGLTETRHAEAAERLADLLGDGAHVAFGTLGDPNLYSTFSALARAVRHLVPGVAIETTPGITAMQALAARTGVVLAEGATPVAIVPLVDDGADALRDALDSGATVVVYKATGRLGDALAALAALAERGRLSSAVYGERIGLDGERVAPAASLTDERAPYLASLIAPPDAPPQDDDTCRRA